MTQPGRYTPAESATEAETLICGECGRVNRLVPGETKSGSIRCSGCGHPLHARRAAPVEIPCPACDELLVIEPDWAGGEARCPSCQTAFMIEAASISDDDFATGGGIPEGWRPSETPGHRRGRRPKRKKRKTPILKRIPWRLVGAFLGCLGLVGAVIVEVGRREGKWLRPAPKTVEQEPQPMEEEIEAEVEKIYSDEWREVVSVAERFLAAEQGGDLAGLIRFETAAMPRATAHFARTLSEPASYSNMAIERVETINGRFFVKLVVVDTDLGHPRFLVLERPSEGRFLVDWDSFVRHRDEDWESFTLREESPARRFQIFVRRYDGDHPAFPFDNHYCFLAYWDNPTDGIPFFVPRESDVETELLRITDPSPDSRARMDTATPPFGSGAATVRLAIDPKLNGEGKTRVATLVELVHPGWVDLRPGDGDDSGRDAPQP